jgi:two-component sensor histidine kinase
MSRTSQQTLGLKLVSALSEQMRARFALDEDGGVVATLEFRVPGPAPGAAPRPSVDVQRPVLE